LISVSMIVWFLKNVFHGIATIEEFTDITTIVTSDNEFATRMELAVIFDIKY